MLISNNFFFDEQRVFEFKVCSCIIDLTFFGIKKFDPFFAKKNQRHLKFRCLVAVAAVNAF